MGWDSLSAAPLSSFLPNVLSSLVCLFDICSIQLTDLSRVRTLGISIGHILLPQLPETLATALLDGSDAIRGRDFWCWV